MFGSPETPSVDLSSYRDQHYKGSRADQERSLKTSTTLYVGNLSFYTTEEQIYELFSKCGDIKRIIMGLDKYKKTPCGFCFVEYYGRADAEGCMRYINGTRLDDRIVRTDWDAGFLEGRQYGRGKSGGQVRDEFRSTFDLGRGGYCRVLEDIIEVAHERSISPNELANDCTDTDSDNSDIDQKNEEIVEPKIEEVVEPNDVEIKVEPV